MDDSRASFEDCRKFWENGFKATLPAGYESRDLDLVEDSNEKRILTAYDVLNDEFGFLLSGKSGVGKTFVLTAFMNKVLKAAYDWRMPMIDAAAYYPIGYLIYQFRTKREAPEFENCLKTQFLFLDDLGTENSTDFAREHFFTILDIRCQKKKPTFITTNLSMNELSAKYGERITSRLKEMCAILELKGADRRSDILQDRISEIKKRIVKPA